MAWETYLAKTAHRKPSEFLIEALSYTKKKGRVLDLGAGALSDAHYLADLGYTVTAVDSNPDVKQYLVSDKDSIDLQITSFADFSFPHNHYILVYARYALPFNHPETFLDMFARMTTSLKKGGVFAGQLFGLEDEWSNRSEMNFHAKQDVESLFSPYVICKLIETKGVRPTASGTDKFWHVFDIIALKR